MKKLVLVKRAGRDVVWAPPEGRGQDAAEDAVSRLLADGVLRERIRRRLEEKRMEGRALRSSLGAYL